MSVAHLDDDERELVLGVLLEEVLTWVRSLPGSSRLKKLAPRWFVVRDARSEKPSLLNVRWAMSYLRGPMTQTEIRKAAGAR